MASTCLVCAAAFPVVNTLIGWDKVLLGLYGMMTPLVIPIVAGLDFRIGGLRLWRFCRSWLGGHAHNRARRGHPLMALVVV